MIRAYDAAVRIRAANYIYDHYINLSHLDVDDLMMKVCATSLVHDEAFAPTWVRASGERCIARQTYLLLYMMHRIGIRV